MFTDLIRLQLDFIFRYSRFVVVGILLLMQLACSSLPQRPAYAVTEKPDVSTSAIHRSLVGELEKHPSQSGFMALNDGIDALAARLALIERAEKTLDLPYYIWHDDLTGRVLQSRLLAAADRGVRVRMLLDDMDTAGKDEILNKLNQHPNIEIRVFNPFPNRNARWIDFMTSPSRVNHRMHNKALIADAGIVVVGGRNIGDEYFNASTAVAFSDMDVLAIGPVTTEVEHAFELYWNSDWSYPLQQLTQPHEYSAREIVEFRNTYENYYSDAKGSAYATALKVQWQQHFVEADSDRVAWGGWRLYYDHPQKVVAPEVTEEYHLAPHLLGIMDQAKSDLVIVSPYFVPGPDFTRYLVNKVKDGVRVRVLTNSLASNDVALVHAGYQRYREELVRGGVELYEFKPNPNLGDKPKKHSWRGSSHASLHGKYLGFDRTHVFVGSFNLDGRSVALNTELGVLFESEKYGQLLSDNFDGYVIDKAYRLQLDDDGDMIWKTRMNGKDAVYKKEPETTWWQRFATGFLSLIVPESQL